MNRIIHSIDELLIFLFVLIVSLKLESVILHMKTVVTIMIEGAEFSELLCLFCCF